MKLLKAAEPRQQPQPRKADAGAQGDGAWHPACGDFAEHVLHLLHRPVRATKEPLALGGEGDGAMAAHQQPDAEPLFERMDLAADGRLGHAQILRGERNAHAPANRDKAANQVQRGKADEWS